MSECSTNPPHQALRLKVVLRRPKTTIGRCDDVTDVTNFHNNHFVRLSPISARRLRDIALSIVQTTPPVINQKHQSRSASRRWWIHHQCSYNKKSQVQLSTKYDSGIEFLPLAITLESTGEIIYASYNGGNLNIDNDVDQDNNTHSMPNGEDADSFIDIPECLLTGWTNRDGKDDDTMNSCFVSVQPLTYIDSTSTLFVDPVTLDDWDLLQSNAVDLEDGRLLQQISIVYSGQVIQLTMSNGTKANLAVMPRNFDRNKKSLWPTDAATRSIKCPCYRLLEDTEFIITPKPQLPMHPIQYPLQLIPTRQDYELFDRAMIQLSEQIPIELVSVQQGSIVIHPNTLARIQSDFNITTVATQGRDPLFAVVQVTSVTSLLRKDANINIKNSPSDDGNISVTVQIIVSKTIPEDHAALHPFVRIRIKGSIFTGRTYVSIKKFLAPIEITKLSTMIPDLVEACDATVQFKRVQLRIPRALSPWHSPMGRIIEHANYIDPSNRNDRQTEPTHNSVFNFGSMCWLPERETSLYRLDLRINDRLRDVSDGFLFTKQLFELRDKVKFDEVKEVFIVEDTSSSRLLSRTLPRHSICLSSPMLNIAESALLRSSVLLYGDSGCGKTFTSLLIAAVARLVRGDKCVYLGCKNLRDSDTIRMKTMLTELEETFNIAYEVAPCVVILDDLDAIAPSFQSSDHADNSALSMDINPTEIDQSRMVSNVLRHLMRAKERRVYVVATTSSTQSLSQFISSKGIFNHQVAVPDVDDNDREMLYCSFLQQSTGEASWSKDSNFVRQISGFRPRDLEILAFRTMKYQSIQSRKIKLHEATSKALEDYVPLSRLTSNVEDKLELTYKLCDIGGLSQPKADLISTIVRPSLYRRIYSHARVRLPRGVLLFGFPGTGKSMCIPALAHECGYPLITCRGPELLDKYIGASEAKIRALFARAAASAPSILFLDELDALAPRRGSDHTGVTDRIVNQLLTFLDGVEDVADSAKGRTVYVIGATSRPDKVDQALLRPGRLEKHIYFGLSDDLIEVKNLLSKISERYTLDEKAIAAIVAGTFVEEMSTLNQSFRLFSAADFTSMFNVAQLMAVRSALDVGRTNGAAEITYENLWDAMMSARPSLSQQDYDRLLGIYKSYRQGQVNPPEKHIQPMLTALK